MLTLALTLKGKTKSMPYGFYAVLPYVSRDIMEKNTLFIQSNVYFVYGGNWNGSSNNVGSNGNYWSSVVKSSNNAYQLNFNVNGNLNPQNNNNRNNGYSLRCVAR